MDIADDNLTLPLPSALMKRAPMQRGVGFLIDDGEEDCDMDVTQPIGGIIPPRDGVNRFLNLDNEDDQTMEFTKLYRPRTEGEGEDDTVGMEFTRRYPANNVHEADNQTVGMEFAKVVGKIQGFHIPPIDKENLPPSQDDDVDGTQASDPCLS